MRGEGGREGLREGERDGWFERILCMSLEAYEVDPEPAAFNTFTAMAVALFARPNVSDITVPRSREGWMDR